MKSATSGSGGGIYNSGTMTITNSTVSGNTSTSVFGIGGRGGGIFHYPDSTLILINSTVTDNSAEEYGTGIHGHESVELLTAS